MIGHRFVAAFLYASVLATAMPVYAQVPWEVFIDPASGAACDVVNAGNLEAVVLLDTGELAVVTGEDYVLELTFIDENGVFFFDGIPVGQISFATDGEGFRSLWLL